MSRTIKCYDCNLDVTNLSAHRQICQNNKSGSQRGRDGSQRGRDGSQRGRDGSQRGRDGPQRGRDGPQRGRDGSQRGRDGSQRGRDGSQRGRDGSQRGRDGSQRGRDGSQTGRDGSQTGRDGSQRGRDGSQTGRDVSQRGRDGNMFIKCYDCYEDVSDIQLHRDICKNSPLKKPIFPIVQQPILQNLESIIEYPALPGIKHENTIDYYAIIDTSESMVGSRIYNAKCVLTDVVARLPESDRIAIVTFNSKPYFPLKSRQVGQIRRQNELPDLLSRFITKGDTAIWDAIWIALEQVRDKSRKIILNILTGGDDNCSVHTYQQILDLVSQYPNIIMNIVHVSDNVNEQYSRICNGRGKYNTVKDVEMNVTFALFFKP
jgi:hypothetical protein